MRYWLAAGDTEFRTLQVIYKVFACWKLLFWAVKQSVVQIYPPCCRHQKGRQLHLSRLPSALLWITAFACWAGTCIERSWLQNQTWTPSAPSSLRVSSEVFRQTDGELLPVLRIEWKVATDGKRWLWDVEQSNEVRSSKDREENCDVKTFTGLVVEGQLWNLGVWLLCFVLVSFEEWFWFCFWLCFVLKTESELWVCWVFKNWKCSHACGIMTFKMGRADKNKLKNSMYLSHSSKGKKEVCSASCGLSRQ